MLIFGKPRRIAFLAGIAALFGAGAFALAPASERPAPLPAPREDLPRTGGTRSVVLAGGCFWGLQGVFEHVKGVRRVVAGYAGGGADTALYEAVGSGRTGHAESVKIEYDPRAVSYGELLQVFFSAAHDPTQVGGQGPDEGSQYRSTVFVANDEEKRVAEAYIGQLGRAKAFTGPITTTLEPLSGFYAAEGYHQDYLIHHPDSMYIVVNDAPKITLLHRLYPELYRAEPVTMAGAGDPS